MSKTNVFRGNLMFASQHQLNFQTSSRRDDLISLCYLLVSLLHNGTFLELDLNVNGMTGNQAITTYKQIKQNLKIKDLCTGNSSDLLEFITEVFNYDFEQQPRYDHLRTLISTLLQNETKENKDKKIPKKSKLGGKESLNC